MKSSVTTQHNKLPDQFWVIAKNDEDKTYFIKNMASSEYFWCYAQQMLRVGQKLHGTIKPPQHPEDYPVLVKSLSLYS